MVLLNCFLTAKRYTSFQRTMGNEMHATNFGWNREVQFV